MGGVCNYSIVDSTVGPSELGIVFKNHLELLTQQDVPFGLQFATEEGLQRDRERYRPLPLHLLQEYSPHIMSFPLTAGVVPLSSIAFTAAYSEGLYFSNSEQSFT